MQALIMDINRDKSLFIIMIFTAYLFAVSVQGSRQIKATDIKKPQASASFKSTHKWTPEKLTGNSRNGLFATPPSAVEGAAFRRKQGDKNRATEAAKDATYRKNRAVAEKQKIELAKLEIKSGGTHLKGTDTVKYLNPFNSFHQQIITSRLEFFKNGQEKIAAEHLPKGEYSFIQGFFRNSRYMEVYDVLRSLSKTDREIAMNKDALFWKNAADYINPKYIELIMKENNLSEAKAMERLQSSYHTTMIVEGRFISILKDLIK